jgi:hypothetical protein
MWWKLRDGNKEMVVKLTPKWWWEQIPWQPIYRRKKCKTAIYSGNRNPQGLAVGPTTGELWGTWTRPNGRSDEINIVKKALAYFILLNYNKTSFTESTTKKRRHEELLFFGSLSLIAAPNGSHIVSSG